MKFTSIVLSSKASTRRNSSFRIQLFCPHDNNKFCNRESLDNNKKFTSINRLRLCLTKEIFASWLHRDDIPLGNLEHKYPMRYF